MLRYLNKFKIGGLVTGSMASFLDDPDSVKVGEIDPPKTDGWQRLRKMFEIDEFGEMSKELNSVTQTALFSGFVGLIYGGFMSSKTAYTDFMRNNTTATFTSHFQAKRKLQDSMTKSFGRGAFRWSWRLSLFSTTFVGVTTMISAYRGQNGIIEYVLAGATAGTLYKWQMGPRGWLVGAGLGAALGLTSGTLTYGLLTLTGVSMDEIRGYQQTLGNTRKQVLKEGMKKYRDSEDALIKAHNEKVPKENDSIEKIEEIKT